MALNTWQQEKDFKDSDKEFQEFDQKDDELREAMQRAQQEMRSSLWKIQRILHGVDVVRSQISHFEDLTEEANETLDLYIQQWDTGFKSRTPDAQKMTMSEMTENSVTFKAVGEGGLAQLKYSRPAIDAFHIDVVTAGDQEFTIKLSPQTR